MVKNMQKTRLRSWVVGFVSIGSIFLFFWGSIITRGSLSSSDSSDASDSSSSHSSLMSSEVTTDACHHVYLDFGTNAGIQVRKVFEPDLYSGARAIPIFNKYFGDVVNRRADVCAFGFEPNPEKYKILKQLASCYNSKGWRTHLFVPGAVATEDKNFTFFSDGLDERGFNMIRGRANCSVPGYNILTFLQRISKRIKPKATTSGTIRKPAVVAKMDIEGAEQFVLPVLLATGMLCNNVIDLIYLEQHNTTWYRGIWAQQLARYFEVTPCPTGHKPTEIVLMDDEMGPVLPLPCSQVEKWPVKSCGQKIPVNCDSWGCTCQGASDVFGISHYVTWGDRLEAKDQYSDVRVFWTLNSCKTRPISTRF